MFTTKMYFSGSMAHPQVVERLMAHNVHRLFTFASRHEAPEYLRACTQRGIRCHMIVDSGAFTAWNIGKPVQLDDLLPYDVQLSRQFPEHDLVFIALDMIPGERGRRATEVEITKAVEQSKANFDVMRQALTGRCVLPVYHSGEARAVRDHYMNLTDYVCLSVNQDLSEGQRVRWAREAFVPGYKFHGLATTGNRMLSLIDWFSVDSSGWLMTAAMGSILLPVGDALKPLSVSSTAPSAKDYGHHLSNMPEAPWIVEYIRSRGYDEQRLATKYEDRICWNIDMWATAPWQKRVAPPEGLFD